MRVLPFSVRRGPAEAPRAENPRQTLDRKFSRASAETPRPAAPLEAGEPEVLSPMDYRTKEPSSPERRDARRAPKRRLTARLALALCAALAFGDAALAASAHAGQGDAPRAGRGEKPAQAKPSPTPYVRPRTVAPKDEGEPQPSEPRAAQPETTPRQAQPQAARPDGPGARQPGGTPEPAGEEVGDEEVVRVDSNLVIIPASVVDGRGRAVTDLKVEDFELRVDGEVKPVSDLSRSETPVNVALLFDNSASLSAAREFEKQAAVRFFRAVVRPIDRAAVYSISTTPTLSQGLTNEVSRLVRTIERFGKPEGATALFDTVVQAAEYLRPVPGRKVLVIVSDGTDTVSDATFEDAINRALRAECQVYVVQTRQVEDPSLHDTFSEQRMYRITEQTGGAVYVPRTVEELDAVFAQISLDLSQQYLLSYYPQDERKDKYFRFISLRVKTRPALRVRARKGFYPAAARAGAKAPGDRAQFSGTLAGDEVPEYLAAAQVTQPGDNGLRRAAGAAPPAPPAAVREAPAPARFSPGPYGPEDDEAARPAARASEPVPTLTLTVTTPAAASKSAPEGAAAARAPTPAASPVVTSPEPSPTPPAAPPTSPPKPEESSAPRGEVKAEAEARDAKAPAGQQSSAAAKPAAPAQPAGGESPKAPVSGGVLNGKAISLPRPAYPPAARAAGASGAVVVEVTIDERGKVIEARAVSGHSFLQQAAVQAARHARFTPATLSGEPVKVKGTINYVFTLP